MTSTLEHDAENCARFSDDIMLQLFNLEQDSEFRPIRPKIILFYGAPRLKTRKGRCNILNCCIALS
ncbi:hypothetical protein ELH93_27295 (plasmid) [Rhizobium leguminosarum]|nr:hypothetical protein ELI40_26230 [Rhizobium leguminosarum]TAV83726.1 hypothetical protein ELI21_27615 [Rhizobium leguminosarum]TAV84303.1 hypothetical protein ELI22_26710 [Rhizobium leguminosarum]TAW26738.1 hypothetical protein ELI23_27660 [Rhizobium leguminosarum]TAX04407.1 hypothetical protein ELI07_28245 [Rhizobium leguminosarum]